MKRCKKLGLLLPLLLLAVGSQAAKNERVELKCHVELFGGNEVIHFVNAKKSQGLNMANKLTGKSIMVSGSREKQKIYRVKECTDLHGKFKGDLANRLDAETVR
ncbi:hypothetical protein SG34_006565 [Thalassomonas viridans]|uniref:Uncharacterized protein n=1 Tax=Thalassomonas viridans TaxID=137584 RepID=A0AAE9Z5R4_9GAMM|nr:TapY2 family type IVa secretion system protein [Thalassomonas viridans]WDE06574.1 hypothetical protein SG34_006565 [Thalassomonas viridans]